MTPKRDTLATTTLVFLLFVLAVASTASTYSMEDEDSHHLSKRSYFDINCKGLYDKSIFARLDRICQDCYSLYREPELHTLCRWKHFYFIFKNELTNFLSSSLGAFLEKWGLYLNKTRCNIRKNCFTTNYFKGCLDALLITDEKDIQRVMKDISIIHQVPI